MTVAFGHVHADLDDGGRNQDLQLAALEGLHRGLFLGSRQAAVQQTDREARKHDLRKMLVHLLGRLHGLPDSSMTG